MDKYDILFVLDSIYKKLYNFCVKLKELNLKTLRKDYYIKKLEWIRMKHYAARTKSFYKNRKKGKKIDLGRLFDSSIWDSTVWDEKVKEK